MDQKQPFRPNHSPQIEDEDDDDDENDYERRSGAGHSDYATARNHPNILAFGGRG